MKTLRRPHRNFNESAESRRRNLLLWNSTGLLGPVPSLSLVFDGVTPFDSRITFTRADATTCATRVNSSGVLETVAANVPRFDYDPTTLACKGLLIEEARTNLVLHSNAFLTLPWNGFATITGNYTNITNELTGLTDAWQIVEMAATGQRIQRQNVTTTNTLSHTISVYVKALPGSLQRYVALRMGDATNIATSSAAAIFDPNTGAIVTAGTNTGVTTGATATSQDVGNGWYRISLSCVPYTSGTSLQVQVNLTNSTTNPVPSYAGDVNSGVIVYGFQCEVGTFPLSYIPTTTATVTRAADRAYMRGATNFDAWFNPTEGTLVGSAEIGSVVLANRCIANINRDTGSTICIYGGISRSADSRRIGAVLDTTNQAIFTPAGSVTSTKFALAYALNNSNAAFDGTLATLDTVCNIPTALTTLYIGNNASGGTQVLNGWVKRISYYPKRIADAGLPSLTI